MTFVKLDELAGAQDSHADGACLVVAKDRPSYPLGFAAPDPPLPCAALHSAAFAEGDDCWWRETPKPAATGLSYTPAMVGFATPQLLDSCGGASHLPERRDRYGTVCLPEHACAKAVNTDVATPAQRARRSGPDSVNDCDRDGLAKAAGRRLASKAWLLGCLLVAAWCVVSRVLAPDAGDEQGGPSRQIPVVAAHAISDEPLPADVVQLGLRNIEDVRQGDYVLAWDEHTGEMAPRRVADTFSRTSDHLRILDIRSADGGAQRIETTDEHPFWVPGRGFIEASELAVDDELVHPNGTIARVVDTAWEYKPGGVPVFNFEVEGLHTYFIRGPDQDALESSQPLFDPWSSLLVHNACTGKGPKRYIIYVADDLKRPGKKYIGRASGYGTPEQILKKRFSSHHRDVDSSRAIRLHETKSKSVARGLEQLVFEGHVKAGTATKQINPISPKNKKGPEYMEAARRFLRRHK